MYTVIGSDENECKDTASITIEVLALPEVLALADDENLELCEESELVLYGSGAAEYEWDQGIENDNSFTITESGTYTVIGIDENNCRNTASIEITVHELPTIDATTDAFDNRVCEGSMVLISAHGAETYIWSNGIEEDIPFQVWETETYEVTGIDDNGCENTAEIMVEKIDLPEITVETDLENLQACYGDEIMLLGEGASSYVWDHDIEDGNPFPIYNTTTFTVIGTTDEECSNATEITIDVVPLPNIIAKSTIINNEVCAEETVTFFGQGATSYTWNHGIVDNVPYQISETSTYKVIGIDDNGCMDTATLDIKVHPLPQVYGGGDKVICKGDSITLTGVGTLDYTWNYKVKNNKAFVPSHSNTFTVTGTDDKNCKNKDDVEVQILEYIIPSIEIESQSEICSNETLHTTIKNSTGTGDAPSYLWKVNDILLDGQNSSLMLDTLTKNTKISVNMTSSYLCTTTAHASHDINIIVFEGPQVNAGEDMTICTGESVTLSASGNGNYYWNHQVENDVPFVPSTTQLYQVTTQNEEGCTNTDQVLVNVELCTDVSTPEATIVSVFPNPSEGIFLLSGLTGTYEIEIFQSHGQFIKKLSGITPTVTIDLTDEQKGIYFLHYKNNLGFHTAFKILLN